MASKETSRKKKDPELSPWVSIKKSSIHRWGGFARKRIPKGRKVIEYIGEKVDKEESARRCEAMNYYVFEVDETYDIDGDVEWNPARYLNHSCKPNCEALNEDNRIWIVSLREIKKGDELTFNYGYSIEDYRDHPCACGAKSCVGYIVAEEFFGDVRKQEKRRSKKGEKE